MDIFHTVNGKEYCNEEAALAELLQAPGLLFVGGSGGPFFEGVDESETPAGIYVNCNDFFVRGAYSLPLPCDQIGAFYKEWKRGRSDNWCCRQEQGRPLKPHIKRMKKDGHWDAEMRALPK